MESRLDRSVKVGDTVEITAGPFARGRAVVQSLDVEKGTVRVVMKVLGEPAPFTLHLNQVHVAEPRGHGDQH